MNIAKAQDELLELSHYAYARGLVSGSGGNISLRLGEQGMLITPSGRSLGKLKKGELIHVRPDGSWHSVEPGPGKPSKEWRMHQLCYHRPEVQAAVHVHSVHAVAVSCRAEDPHCAMPIYTPGYGLRAGHLPLLPYILPGSAELAEAAGAVIATRNSVLLANHGVLAVGQSAEEAMNIVEEIEENAQVALLLGGHGRALSPEQVTALCGYK